MDKSLLAQHLPSVSAGVTCVHTGSHLFGLPSCFPSFGLAPLFGMGTLRLRWEKWRPSRVADL